MSVFTHLEADEIAALLAPLGYRLEASRAAAEGIENSNYLLECSRDGERIGLVLTIFEELPEAHLPWFVALLEGLSGAGVPVPAPVAPLLRVRNKPALLAPWLPGRHVGTPTPAHCAEVGALLARLHRGEPPGGPPGSERRSLRQLGRHIPDLPAAWHAAAKEVLAAWLGTAGTPTLVHADLFRDNLLFSGSRVTGVLDFYHACVDLPVYDLAVALNDWCVTPEGAPDPARERALLEGYGPLSPDQAGLLPLALCAAALRFWLSRIRTAARGTQRKDPLEFERIFAYRHGDWQRGG